MDRHRLDGPFAWTGQRFEAANRWRFELTRAEADDLERAVETAQAAGRSAHDVRREHFPLPVLGAKLADIAREIENGCGVARVFGLPVERYVEAAQLNPDVPKMSQAQWEALDMLADVCRELHTAHDFEPGEMQILNNHVVYHARDAYEDSSDPEDKRLLYRVWICPPVNRPLPHGHEVLWGNIEANSLRGGIERSV